MELASVDFTEFDKGYSPTVLFQARPKNAAGRFMIWCAIKIGDRHHIKTEYVKYNRYVRYNMSPVRRVELLGYAMADTMGALCYSFAGERPERAVSLGSLMDVEDERVYECLRVLLNPAVEERDWYSVSDKAQVTLGGLRERLAYGPSGKVVDALSEMEGFVNDVVKSIQRDDPGAGIEFFRRKPNSEEAAKIVLASGHGILVPDQYALVNKNLQVPFFQCIVHGDLHGKNVLVSFDSENRPPRVVRIDFVYTGLGPIAHEFAQLEVTVRTSNKALEVSPLRMIEEQAIERSVSRAVWSQRIDEDSPHAPRAEWPYWANVSYLLGWLARKNFHQDGKEYLSATEYAATCFMTAAQRLRLEMAGEESLRHEQKGQRQPEKLTEEERQARRMRRMRMMVWMSHLVQELQHA
jgi:hypothetical protein